MPFLDHMRMAAAHEPAAEQADADLLHLLKPRGIVAAGTIAEDAGLVICDLTMQARGLSSSFVAPAKAGAHFSTCAISDYEPTTVRRRDGSRPSPGRR
jgi:hypothetical protein